MSKIETNRIDDILKNRIILNKLSPDIYNELKILYDNIDFRRISNNATRQNNELIFENDSIIFKDYKYKRFKSDDENPCFNQEDIKLSIRPSKYMSPKEGLKDCVDLQLWVLTDIKNRHRAKVRYKILLNRITYEYLQKFITICKIESKNNNEGEV